MLHDRSLQLASALQAHVNALTGAATDKCEPLQLSRMLEAGNDQLDGSFADTLRHRCSSSPISVVVVGNPTVAQLPGDVPYSLHQVCDHTHAIVELNMYVLPVCLRPLADSNNGSCSVGGAAAASKVADDPVEAREWVAQQLRAELGQASRLPRWADLDALLARLLDEVVLVGDSDDEVDCSSSSSGGSAVASPACFHQARLARALAKFGRAVAE